MASCEKTAEGWRLYVRSDLAAWAKAIREPCLLLRIIQMILNRWSCMVKSAMPDNGVSETVRVKRRGREKLYFLFARKFFCRL